MTWAALIVAHLQRSKRAGESFENAWAMALAAHPPRGRDLGELRPSLFDPPTEGAVEFTRRVCGDAWHNRDPESKLRYFAADTLLDHEALVA